MRGDGSGLDSVYGGPFDDEAFLFRHDRGTLAMAAAGPDRNGCQFMVCLATHEALDGSSVAFGRVVSGLRVRVACVWRAQRCGRCLACAAVHDARGPNAAALLPFRDLSPQV